MTNTITVKEPTTIECFRASDGSTHYSIESARSAEAVLALDRFLGCTRSDDQSTAEFMIRNAKTLWPFLKNIADGGNR